jgi:uncharacterized protein
MIASPWRALRGVLVVCLLAAPAAAQPLPPELTQPVNDLAGVIDRDSASQLDALIRQLQSATGDVLVVATVRTFAPYADLKSYAVKMFENHGRGIGGRAGDTGALIVMAVDDRQVWIEVGYGLEGFITDGFAGETSRETMVPFFRSGDYGRGLLAGATRVALRIAEGRNVTLNVRQVARPEPAPGIRINPILAIFLLWILFRVITARMRRASPLRRARWTSGVGPFGGSGWSGGGWGGSSGGLGGGFGGFGGGRSGGGGGGGSW